MAEEGVNGVNRATDADNEAAPIIRKAYAELGSWPAVAKRYGVNRGLLYRVAKGELRSNTVREALDLPLYYVAEVEGKPCPCGCRVRARKCGDGKRLDQLRKSDEPLELVRHWQAAEWLRKREGRR